MPAFLNTYLKVVTIIAIAFCALGAASFGVLFLRFYGEVAAWIFLGAFFLYTSKLLFILPILFFSAVLVGIYERQWKKVAIVVVALLGTLLVLLLAIQTA